MRQWAESDNGDYAIAYVAPPDEGSTRWLHLTVSRSTERSAEEHSKDKKKYPISAMSSPFLNDQGDLVQELKYVGWPCEEYRVEPFTKQLGLFGMDPPFLEFVTWWYNQLRHQDPQAMKAMRRHFTRTPVEPTLPYPPPTPGAGVPNG